MSPSCAPSRHPHPPCAPHRMCPRAQTAATGNAARNRHGAWRSTAPQHHHTSPTPGDDDMPNLTKAARTWRAAAVVAALAAGPVFAQDQTAQDRLVLELNTTQTTAAGCLLSFLVTNGLSGSIDAMVLEAVLFDTDGKVERLTLFDFGALPAGRPRVRQFEVPGPACEAIGSVLINGAQTCTGGEGVATQCDKALDLRSRSDINLIG